MSRPTPPRTGLKAERRTPSKPRTKPRTGTAKPKPKAPKTTKATGGKPSGAKSSAARRKPVRSRKPARRSNLIVRFFRWVIRLFWRVTWRVGLVVGLVLGAFVLIDMSNLPPSEQMLDGRTRGSVTILDRRGEVFAWRGDQFGGGVTADSVSPHLKNAIVATEDRRFYRHPGLDPIGIIGAMRINLSEGRSALSGHGGSTITQQTAKLLCAGRAFDPTSGQTEAQYESECREGSLQRKAREAVYALAMEAKYTKDEILTIYMNRAYLGAGTRGFEAASQRYFSKPASAVRPAEAAMLAGLLKAPTRFAPTANLARSQERATVIVGLMEAQGYLSASEAAEARAQPARLSAAAASRTGGYFADWVMGEAPDWWGRDTTEDVVMKTTLDMDMQIAAEEALAYVFETKVRAGSSAESAIVVMDADGAVRAMVGGRQSDVPGGFNRATQAKRQTGSAFKPFVYATALELGYSYRDLVEDAPLTINVPGSGPWSPKNYSRNYKGMVTLTDALKDSLNIPAVKVSEAVGRENVMRVASDFGIDSTMHNGPSLALGVSEASLLELTAAYAGILNGGRSVGPYGLTALRVFGDSQPQIQNTGGIGERVIARSAAQQLTYMMYQVVENGTGRRAKLDGRPAAGKTGTTQAARDAWFVGFTGDYVVGVWMGYDDNTPLTGVTGGGLPADIWRETMLRVHDGMPVTPLPMITPESDPGRVVAGTAPTAPATPSTPSRQTQPQRPQMPDLASEAQKLGDRIRDGIRGLFGGN